MKNQKISKQFTQMGTGLLINALIGIFFFYLYFENIEKHNIDLAKAMSQTFGLIQILFFIWYINWWFKTANLFNTMDVDVGVDNRKQSASKKSIPIIIAVIIIMFYFFSRP